MKAEEQRVSEQQEQGVKQATIVLPYFEEEVPVLYLADGTAYLTVKSLCHMLGLRAETYILRWRKLVVWANARKLPLQTARGRRIVWCLHMGALPLLKTVYTRAGEELTDPQEGCKLKDIKIKTSGEQPCLGVRPC